jgi:hypothetical protein
MTGVLKFLTVGLWILILMIWIGDLWVGIPTDVSDDVTKGIVEPMKTDIDNAIQTRRIISALILIPALTVFGLIIHSIRKRKNRLFYIGMTITIIPLLTIGILGLVQDSEMPYKNIILIIITIPLTLGLLKGLLEIFGGKKMELKKE